VNGIIEELYRVFQVTGIVTPPYRPQANGIEERTGGEVVRHLRALVEHPDARILWSVVLPLAVRIVNHTYKWWLGCRPYELVCVQPWEGDRGLFDPLRPVSEVVPVSSGFMRELHSAYEVFLDETSRKIVEIQRQLEQHCADQQPKPVSVNDLVLISQASSITEWPAHSG